MVTSALFGVPFMPARACSFSGVVAAKLPFVPFSLIQKISHRGLEGDDPTDCSVVSGGKLFTCAVHHEDKEYKAH